MELELTPARALLALALALHGLSACSGPASPAVTARPPGDWQGVYQGPYHIYLGIAAQGDTASGTWRAIGEREGEFTGRFRGNRLELDWSEHGQGTGSWAGRGYFVYQEPGTHGATEIFGEWGLGGAMSGNSWWAVKRRGVALDSAQALRDTDSVDDGDKDDAACSTCDETQEFERE